MNTKQEIIKLLREEIKWCSKNKDKSGSLSQLETKGFIKGLRHAVRLAQLFNPSK